jgi:hypothetical protein
VATSVSEPEVVVLKHVVYGEFNCSKCNFETYNDDNSNQQQIKRMYTEFEIFFPPKL